MTRRKALLTEARHVATTRERSAWIAVLALHVAIATSFACTAEPNSGDEGDNAAGMQSTAGTLPLAGTAGVTAAGAGGAVAGNGMSAGAGASAGTAAGASGVGGVGAGVGGAGGASGTGGGAGNAGAAGQAGSEAGAAGVAGMPAGAGGEGGALAGAGGEAGSVSETCPLPETFEWTSTGPLAEPQMGWVSLKDFTHVLHEGKHVVYMTTHDNGSSWGSAMFTFDDWPDAASATQHRTSFGVAATLFYFTPKDIWVLAYQWGSHRFSYRTSSNPSDPNGWGSEQRLYNTNLANSPTGPIDQTIICDSETCYLYFAGDNGHVYKSTLPIDDFPGEFPAAEDSGIQGTTQNLFEGVQVYSIKGSSEYLMIVEAQGNGRYFRAWTATDLGGPWNHLTDAFASQNNTTFTGGQWTDDISHGDLIRENPDETFTIDPCNLQMLYQGRDPNVNTDYGRLPYRPGLLTLQRP